MILLEILISLNIYMKENYPKLTRYLFVSIGFFIIYSLLMLFSSSDLKIYHTFFGDSVYTDENQITFVIKDEKELWSGKTKSVIKKEESFIITTENGEIKSFHFDTLNPVIKNKMIQDKLLN